MCRLQPGAVGEEIEHSARELVAPAEETAVSPRVGDSCDDECHHRRIDHPTENNRRVRGKRKPITEAMGLVLNYTDVVSGNFYTFAHSLLVEEARRQRVLP